MIAPSPSASPLSAACSARSLPPSIVFVVYAVLAQGRGARHADRGDPAWPADDGAVSGHRRADGTCATIIRAANRLSWGERGRALLRALPMLAIPAVIVGTISRRHRLADGERCDRGAGGGADRAVLHPLVETLRLPGDSPAHRAEHGARCSFSWRRQGVFSWVLIFGQVPRDCGALDSGRGDDAHGLHAARCWSCS